MAITDAIAGRDPDDAADGAKKVRRALLNAISTMESALSQVRKQVDTHTRAAIVTELGSDATDAVAVYNAIKDVLTSTEIARAVDDLPS